MASSSGWSRSSPSSARPARNSAASARQPAHSTRCDSMRAIRPAGKSPPAYSAISVSNFEQIMIASSTGGRRNRGASGAPSRFASAPYSPKNPECRPLPAWTALPHRARPEIGRASCRESDWSSDVCSSDLIAELQARRRDLRAHRILRRTQNAGHFPRGQPFHIAQDQRRALLLAEATQPAADNFPLLGALRIMISVRLRRYRVRHFREANRTAPAARDIAADVNGHAVQPRFVPARLVQIAEMLVEPQENFLGGILGVLRVIQQAQRAPEDPTLALRHDPLEGSQLAGVFPRVSGHAQRNSFRLHF